MYSFGTYTRETETVRWSSISLASFRANSTGCTLVRKARPKIPSKRASILCSSARRTMTGDTRRSMLTNGYNETGGPHGHHERDRGNARDGQ